MFRVSALSPFQWYFLLISILHHFMFLISSSSHLFLLSWCCLPTMLLKVFSSPELVRFVRSQLALQGLGEDLRHQRSMDCYSVNKLRKIA